MSVESKRVVESLIRDVINGGELDRLDDLCTSESAARARAWISPFRKSFPDVEMTIVELVAEGESVAGRFRCSATNLGPWRGNPPTGRRFEDVDEVYFFHLEDGRIAEMWGLEDTHDRLRQLGLSGDG